MSRHTGSAPRTRRAVAMSIAAAGCAAMLSLAACTSANDSGDGSSAAGTPDASSAESGPGAGRVAEDTDTTAAATELSENAIAQRAIERHGSLELSSARPGETRDEVIAAAGQAGGYVASEHSTTDDDGDLSHAGLQLVVPTDAFDSAMRGIAEAGTVVSREQSADDVTDEVVDVDSRVRSAEASLQRVRLLLGRAQSLGDVIRLESVLGERQADLEALQARQRSLAARTSTATIDVVVRPATPEPGPRPDDDDAGFVAGLDAGWDTLRTIGVGLLTGVGAALPFALAIGIPAAPVALLVHRMRRRRTAEAT